MSQLADRSWTTWGIPVVIYVVAVLVYALLGSLQSRCRPTSSSTGTSRVRSRTERDSRGTASRSSSRRRSTSTCWLRAGCSLRASPPIELAKLTGALTACAVVFPVWVLARRLMSPAAPPSRCVLTVAGTWMLSTAGC